MTVWQKAAPSSFLAGSQFVIFTSFFAICGCSRQDDAADRPPAVNAQRPKPSLAVGPSVDRLDIRPGSSVDILCTVTVDPAFFEPMIATFQVSAPVERGKSKTVFNSETISKKPAKGNTYTFLWPIKSPNKPGRYLVEAKVVGVNPSLPTPDPAPAPAADGTRAKSGALAELDATILEIEIKK